MKNLSLILIIAVLLISGCSSNELSREEAFRLIKDANNYPRVVDDDIYIADPREARILLDKGLEATGLLTIQKTQKMTEAGKPLIHFTDKAKPYLISMPPDSVQYIFDMQKVKIADEDISEITAILPDKSNNTAVVEYMTIYKNITPFAALRRMDLKKPRKRTAYFALSDEDWIVRKPRQ